MAAKYTESDRVRKLAEELTAFDGQKPEKWAGGTYGESMKDAMQKVLNRDKFRYDLNGDALYQQYKDRYIQQGKQAMMDTIGQASALTGGYGNSYAQQAGQQTYQGYLQGLNDKVPELYRLALDRYNQEGTDLLNKYGLLSDQYDKEYSRYREDVSDWQAQRDYLANLFNSERNFDYTGFRDQVADDQWQKNFDEALRQYNVLQNRNGSTTRTWQNRNGSTMHHWPEGLPRAAALGEMHQKRKRRNMDQAFLRREMWQG